MVVPLVVLDVLGGRGRVVVTVVGVGETVFGGPLTETDDAVLDEVADGFSGTDADAVGTTGTVVGVTDEPAGTGSGSTTAAVAGAPTGWATTPW